MSENKLIRLSKQDPLYKYLKCEILPQLIPGIRKPEFSVTSISQRNNQIFLYEEMKTKVKIVGKFPKKPKHSSNERALREFQNLVNIRGLGFVAEPVQVVRPLGYNTAINHVLLQEYVEGEDLGVAIKAAIHEGKVDELRLKLSRLAFFLATMHNRTPNGEGVDFSQDCFYFYQLTDQLRHLGMSKNEAYQFYDYCHQWKGKGCMYSDGQVLVHGDATPANFIFGPDSQLTVIDLERVKYGDRLFDVGRITGELVHYYMLAEKPQEEAEALIEYFLWEYASYFPHQMDTMRSLVARVQFYIATTLMRIARNEWLSVEYRSQLRREARHRLKS